MPLICRFTVEGIPQTAGSKRAFPFHKPGGKLGVSVTDDNRKSKAWKRKVALESRLAMNGRKPTTAPVVLFATFYLPRPKYQMGSGRNSHQLKPSAPKYHVKTPDALKLARAVEDAMSHVIYDDDSQIIEEVICKEYGNPPRVEIEVHELETF